MLNQKIETRLRPFTLDDAQTVVDLFNDRSQRLFGADECQLNIMLIDWTNPKVDLEEMARVVEDRDGNIIGYIDLWDVNEPYVTKYVWGILHPDAWDDDLYREMLAWAEDYARSRISLGPEGARVILSQGIETEDTSRKNALEAYGYKLARNFYRMVIELDQAPPEPVIPEGLTIMPIDLETELRDAIAAMEEGFVDHWGSVEHSLDDLLEEWRHLIDNDEDFDPSIWYLAKDGDQIAGVCQCSNKIPEDSEMGWVDRLCVLRPWRRRGLGTAMLQTAFKEFYRRGKKRVGLVVDATSLTNATRLYDKAGMHVTRQYNTYHLEIRPGKNLTTT
jgi:mycothiol synthase